MNIKWHDVSLPLHPDMAVWPGDPAFSIQPDARIAAGDGCNTSHLALATHTGTHCDAPWHFEDNGKKLQDVDTGLFFGKAFLLDMTGHHTIRAADLPTETLPPRLLIKTDNAARPADAPFHNDFVALEEDAAERLVEDGVQLVGIDYLSIAPKGRSGPTHHRLLKNEVFVIEGLRLDSFPQGYYEFTVLPMPLQDADGAPCRAFLGVPE
jgi:arylformamidase